MEFQMAKKTYLYGFVVNNLSMHTTGTSVSRISNI